MSPVKISEESSIVRDAGEEMIQRALALLVEGKNLSKIQAKKVMREIMQGRATSAQIAALLVALRMKKETVEEIVGLAEEMMSEAISFAWDGDILVDTCGTGGDNLGTFNVSTTCAFVVAAAGVQVAKHGNRALSSRCGSADVLEEMGLRLDVPASLVKKALDEIGIGFLYAPSFHKAMKYALPTRQQIGVRTVFNVLGPLTNPLRANVRLMGVYDPSFLTTLAEVISRLGAKRAFIVWGEDGLDEITVTGKTRIAELNEGKITSYWIEPEQVGIKRWSLEEIKGGDRKMNALIIRQVLEGKERGAKRDMVLVNSAFCLVGAKIAAHFRDGVKVAADVIDSGRALEKLHQLIEFTNSFST